MHLLMAEKCRTRMRLLASIFVWTIFLFALLSIKDVEAFKCYVCDSKDDLECTENPPNNAQLPVKDCKNITGAKYCVKTTKIYGGEFGTKRFCSSEDHGNTCKHVEVTGQRFQRSCILTCYSELCNGSQSIYMNLFSGLSVMHALIVVSFSMIIKLIMYPTNF